MQLFAGAAVEIARRLTGLLIEPAGGLGGALAQRTALLVLVVVAIAVTGTGAAGALIAVKFFFVAAVTLSGTVTPRVARAMTAANRRWTAVAVVAVEIATVVFTAIIVMVVRTAASGLICEQPSSTGTHQGDGQRSVAHARRAAADTLKKISCLVDEVVEGKLVRERINAAFKSIPPEFRIADQTVPAASISH